MAVSLLLVFVFFEVVVCPFPNRVERASVATIDSVLQRISNGLRGVQMTLSSPTLLSLIGQLPKDFRNLLAATLTPPFLQHV